MVVCMINMLINMKGRRIMNSSARKIFVIALVSLLAVSAGGCISRAIKEGVGAARGARGSHADVKAVVGGSSALAGYDNFELGDIQDDFSHTPRELFSALRTNFASELAKSKLPTAGSRTLLIRGKIIHFELSGSFGHAFGPLEQVIARIELVDKASGRVLGSANCVGRTNESNTSGVIKKAEGLAKAIVGLVKKHHPSGQ